MRIVLIRAVMALSGCAHLPLATRLLANGVAGKPELPLNIFTKGFKYTWRRAMFQ